MFFSIIKTSCLVLLSTLFSLNLLWGAQAVPGEKRDFGVEIKKLNTSVTALSRSNQLLRKDLIEQNKKIETLQRMIESNEANLKKDVMSAKNETQRIWNRTLLWIAFTILTMIISLVRYIIIRKKLKTDASIIEDRIKQFETGLKSHGIS
jgi:hypothetical protein